jgi:restriction system protein
VLRGGRAPAPGRQGRSTDDRPPGWAHLRDFDDLLDLTWLEFERFAGDVLRALGYLRVRHTGGAGDESVDVWCTGEGGERVAVQCKKYRPPRAVGTPEMQQFVGMIYAHHRASRGIYVTTSRFGERAVAMAQRHSIQLIDGLRLCRLMDWQPPVDLGQLRAPAPP